MFLRWYETMASHFPSKEKCHTLLAFKRTELAGLAQRHSSESCVDTGSESIWYWLPGYQCLALWFSSHLSSISVICLLFNFLVSLKLELRVLCELAIHYLLLKPITNLLFDHWLIYFFVCLFKNLFPHLCVCVCKFVSVCVHTCATAWVEYMHGGQMRTWGSQFFSSIKWFLGNKLWSSSVLATSSLTFKKLIN